MEDSDSDGEDVSTSFSEDLLIEKNVKEKEEEEEEDFVSCPCSANDIGEFYSALWALAVGLEI